MKASLRVKLTVLFLSGTLIVFLVIGMTANILLERQFKNYVVSELNRKNEDLSKLLIQRYGDWGGVWNKDGLENIGINALSEGFILRVKDQSGNAIWDAHVHNSGFCTAMLGQMASNMQRYQSGFEGGYTEKTISLLQNGVPIGSVDIGYYGPYFFSENDMRYLGALNRLLLWSAILCAALAMMLGIYFAKRQSDPIKKATDAARQIARGDYDARFSDQSGTTELTELSRSVNTLAETLARQETLRKRLTADVAHELRTPLATLQSHLEAMIDGVWAADSDRLKSCHEETIRLGKLVGDLDKLANFEAENLTLELEPFDFSRLIERVSLNYQGEYAKKNILLKTDANPLMIEADEDKISQVLVNLLSNALRYTGEGGSVTVSLREKDGHAHLCVRDTGIGISKDEQPLVFERFYRADQSRNRKLGGSGIGLAIVKSIVDAHHGSVSLESTPGIGSAFTIVLPLHPAG